MAAQLRLDDIEWRSSPLFSQGDSLLKSTGVSPVSTSRGAEERSARDHLQHRAKVLQQTLAQETERNERIERENEHLRQENQLLRQSVPNSSSVSEEISRYLHFALSTMESVTDLRVLFYGRVRSAAAVQKACSEGLWQTVCLQLLQVLSDFVVYYLHQTQEKKAESRAVPLGQTKHMQTPSLSALFSTSEQPIFEYTQQGVDRTLSPGFQPSPASDFTRLYDEHRSLLASLNSQSDRLTRLNTQLTATMSSSRRLLASRPSLSPNKAPKDPSFELIPAVSVLPPANSPIFPSQTNSPDSVSVQVPASKSKSPPRRSKIPIYRGKPIVGKRVEPLSRGQLGSKHCQGVREQGWTSVGDYFKAGEEEQGTENTGNS